MGGDRLKVNKIDFTSKKKGKDRIFTKIDNHHGVAKYTDRTVDDSLNYEIDLRKLGLKMNPHERERPSAVEKER